MKKIVILLVLSTLGLCYTPMNAQETDDIVNNIEQNDIVDTIVIKDTVVVTDTVIIDDAVDEEITETTPRRLEVVTEKMEVRHIFGVGATFWGQDDLNGSIANSLPESEGEITDVTDLMNYGFTLDYKLSFTPLQKMDSGRIKNPCNIGYSTGLIFAGDFGKAGQNTLFSWDALASGGISLGTSNIGVNLDILLGLGGVNGYYMYLPIDNPDEMRLDAGNKIVCKYGFQVAFKIGCFNKGVLGSLFNALSSIGGDMSNISLFARFLMATSPKDYSSETEVYTPLFPTNSIQVGLMLNF